MDPNDDNEDDVTARLQQVRDKLKSSLSAGEISEVSAVPTPGPTVTEQPSEAPTVRPPNPVEFASVISQIKILLAANPSEQEVVENRKIMRAIRRHFRSLLENEREPVDEGKKSATMAIAEQIAIWVEAIIKEADTLGSSSTVISAGEEIEEEVDDRHYPVLQKKSSIYEVTLQEDDFFMVRNLKRQTEEEWEKWVSNALQTAEDWCYWISNTCAQAEEHGARASDEESDQKLTYQEFNEWRKAVGLEGVEKIRKARAVLEGKENWIGNVPVSQVREQEEKEAKQKELQLNFVGPGCESDEDLKALEEMKAEQARQEEAGA